MKKVIDAPRLPEAPMRTDALAEIGTLPPLLALQRALPIVRDLASEYAGLLDPDMYVARLAESGGGLQIVGQLAGRDAAWWLGYFRWAPGAATPIHDHTSWGLYACAGGTLLEARYRRLDDGAQKNRAHLRLQDRRWLGAGDYSSLLPYAGGIHSVHNPGAAPAWSVHLYGPRLGRLDGRDYDPARDIVCDRWA